MKYRLLLTLLASSVLLLGSVSAKAGLIDISGGTSGTISTAGFNDLVNPVYGTNSRAGFFGAQLLYGASGNLVFDIEYLGKEAGFVNTFVFNGSQVFSTATNSPGDTAGPFPLLATLGGLIPFEFNTNTTRPAKEDEIENGDPNVNPDPEQTIPTFFVTCVDDPTSRNCNQIDIFLDDGGAGPDDNHDDLAVRLTARVPEPMTLALLGLGLIGISFTSRKKA